MSGRRSLFGAAAAVLIAPAAVAATDLQTPDAELIAIGREALPLLEEYKRLNRAWFATEEGSSEVDAVGDA